MASERRTVPRSGDTLVTLTVDTESHSLEDRVHLLGYAFIKAVQGSFLRQVLMYDLVGGIVKFIVAGPVTPPPRGEFTAKLEGVESTVQTIEGGMTA